MVDPKSPRIFLFCWYLVSEMAESPGKGDPVRQGDTAGGRHGVHDGLQSEQKRRVGPEVGPTSAFI